MLQTMANKNSNLSNNLNLIIALVKTTVTLTILVTPTIQTITAQIKTAHNKINLTHKMRKQELFVVKINCGNNIKKNNKVNRINNHLLTVVLRIITNRTIHNRPISTHKKADPHSLEETRISFSFCLNLSRILNSDIEKR